jgi:DNA (cytosine-5)-methyltransferase 1
VNKPQHHTDHTPGQATNASRPVMSVAMTPGPVIGSLCTGYGGLDLAVLAALGGGRIAWCADPDPHIAVILTTRMPNVPNLGDLRTVAWTEVEPIDVLTAGFPCQDISAAGKRAGIEKGQRSGLWTDIVAVVRVLRPALLVVENVAALRWRHGGLHRVLGDLAQAGYDAIWRSVRAADIGAAHHRERLFLLGWPHGSQGDAAHSPSQRWDTRSQRLTHSTPSRWTSSQPSRCHYLLHTAAAHPDRLRQRKQHAADQRGGPSLPNQARRLPTPRASDTVTAGHRPGAGFRSPLSRHVLSLADSETLLPTPRASDGTKGCPAQRGSHGDLMLPSAIIHLPTPPDEEDYPAAPEDPPNGESSMPTTDDHSVDWGAYSAAIHRWEHVLGRRAPCPTQSGRHGRPVLSPAFVEHLMGLPPGWVTDLSLPRTAQLRALGNGVVPQQATYAVSLLLADLATLTTAERSDFGQELNAA